MRLLHDQLAAMRDIGKALEAPPHRLTLDEATTRMIERMGWGDDPRPSSPTIQVPKRTYPATPTPKTFRAGGYNR